MTPLAIALALVLAFIVGVGVGASLAFHSADRILQKTINIVTNVINEEVPMEYRKILHNRLMIMTGGN